MFDKQNSLTFQNITQTMKINKANKHHICSYHPHRTAKFRNRDTPALYCVSCAIQEASRGQIVQDISKSEVKKQRSSSFNLLQQIYQQSQDQIQQFIQIYNSKYQRLLDSLTDMQIRDLITFNRKIEENHNLFKELKNSLSDSWNRQQLSHLFSNSNNKLIINKIDQIYKDINFSQKSNQITSSRFKSKMASPFAQSKSSSPQPLIRNRSQDIFQEQFTLRTSNNSFQGQIHIKSKDIRQSFPKSQPNTGSFQSKTSTIQQTKKGTIQDTPESVKQKMSQSHLKLPTNAAVTMFEKIDICQSIDMGGQQQIGKSQGQKASASSLKRKNRYQQNA